VTRTNPLLPPGRKAIPEHNPRLGIETLYTAPRPPTLHSPSPLHTTPPTLNPTSAERATLNPTLSPHLEGVCSLLEAVLLLLW
jgi:hypothetical protein